MQKFFREYIERRASKERSVHLHAGGALATGFETFRRAYYTPESHLCGDVNACKILAARELIKYWGHWDPPDSETKQFDRVLGSFWDYFDIYPPELDRVQPLMLAYGPAIEWTFAEPLPILHPVTGEPLLYCGRFDMFGTLGRALYVVDEKSGGRVDKHWTSSWRLRYQLLGYTWAARKNDFDVLGAIIRGIIIYTKETACPEAIMNYSNDTISKWYNQLLRDVQRLVDAWNSKYWDYDFSEGCMSYFKPCEFMDLCDSRTPEAYYGDFSERLWNPLEKDPTRVKELQDA